MDRPPFAGETEGAGAGQGLRINRARQTASQDDDKSRSGALDASAEVAGTGYWFRRQHPIGPYNADFALVESDLVIEVDGATHSTPEEIAHDEKRDAYMRALGWTIFRIPNASIYEDVAWTVAEIVRRWPPPSRP